MHFSILCRGGAAAGKPAAGAAGSAVSTRGSFTSGSQPQGSRIATAAAPGSVAQGTANMPAVAARGQPLSSAAAAGGGWQSVGR